MVRLHLTSTKKCQRTPNLRSDGRTENDHVYSHPEVKKTRQTTLILLLSDFQKTERSDKEKSSEYYKGPMIKEVDVQTLCNPFFFWVPLSGREKKPTPNQELQGSNRKKKIVGKLHRIESHYILQVPKINMKHLQFLL